jgi:putative endonuclease
MYHYYQHEKALMAGPYYVYMLTNQKLNVLYTGITNDLIRRTYEHKNKIVDGFTKKYHVNKLVYYEVYEQVIDAITREKQIKGWSRKKKNALVDQLNPDWQDLYEII